MFFIPSVLPSWLGNIIRVWMRIKGSNPCWLKTVFALWIFFCTSGLACELTNYSVQTKEFSPPINIFFFYQFKIRLLKRQVRRQTAWHLTHISICFFLEESLWHRRAGLEEHMAPAGKTWWKINHNGSLWFIPLVPTSTKSFCITCLGPVCFKEGFVVSVTDASEHPACYQLMWTCWCCNMWFNNFVLKPLTVSYSTKTKQDIFIVFRSYV